MRMAPWKTQQTSPNFLLVTSESPWKPLVVIHNGSIETIKDTTEAFTALLDQYLLTVINMKTNGTLHQKHQKHYIDSISIAH